jgi:hypothetical protein
MSPLLLGAVLGATGAFLLDPDLGRRRRALIRDKVTRGMTEGREFTDAATQDLQQRARGIAARVRRLRTGRSNDDVLVERVRARLRRACSHPGAIEITAFNGHLVLTGDVLAAEQEQVFDAVRSVRGVEHVDNKLSAYATAEAIASLQGAAKRQSERFALLEANWSPGIRLVTGGAGALLLLYALARGGFSGIGALGLGAVLLGRASTNQPLRRALGKASASTGTGERIGVA